MSPRPRTLARAVAASAATGLALLGIGVLPAHAAPPAIEAGSIIVEDANGAPVDGAIVELGVASEGPFASQLMVATGPDGTVDLASVPGVDTASNPYTIWVMANGYSAYWDGATDVDSTVPITIGAGGPLLTTTVPANDPPDATSAGIAGTITDSITGLPVPGIQVSAVDVGGQGDNSGSGQSGADGTYYLNFTGGGLPSMAGVSFTGVLTYEDAPYGYGTQYFDDVLEYSSSVETPVDVTAGQTSSGIDAAMVPNGQISGLVTLDGAPLANAQVSAWSDGSQTVLGSASTDATGRYSFPAAPGTYTVQFEQLDSGGDTVATLWFSDVATQEAAATVTVRSNTPTDDIDAHFGITPVVPTPTPTPALAESGGSGGSILPALLIGLAVVAAGAAAVVGGRRTRRVG